MPTCDQCKPLLFNKSISSVFIDILYSITFVMHLLVDKSYMVGMQDIRGFEESLPIITNLFDFFPSVLLDEPQPLRPIYDFIQLTGYSGKLDPWLRTAAWSEICHWTDRGWKQRPCEAVDVFLFDMFTHAEERAFVMDIYIYLYTCR